MIWLADNYVAGIIVACIVVLIIYIGISLVIMFSAREEGLDICVSAMIPVWNLGILLRTKFHKKKRILAEKEMEQEIDLF